jgi:hypothetical protein
MKLDNIITIDIQTHFFGYIYEYEEEVEEK